MSEFLNGSIPELEAAKTAVINEAQYSLAEDEAQNVLKKAEKELETQKKRMNDRIDSSIKSGRSEIEKTHEDRIDSARKNLKDAQRKRNDAKTEAVNSRIGNATATLVNENGQLLAQIKAQLKQWKLPGFVNTSYYYSMFATKTPIDFLVFALTVLVCIALIPNVVCWIIGSNATTVGKVFIYIAIVVFFIALYFIVMFWTKSGKKAKVIESIRPTRKAIKENKKRINELSKNIINDKDESTYGLSAYDTEIEKCNEAVKAFEAEKAAALDQFDKVTAPSLKSQIEGELLPGINELSAKVESYRQDWSSKQKLAQDASTLLATEYAVFLGKKNLDPERIDDLIAIIKEGKAQTIMQALDVQSGVAATPAEAGNDENKA